MKDPRIEIISLLVTVLVAIGGYLATYLNNLRLERRKAEIQLVNDQLKLLYGPLFAATSATGAAWKEFRSKYRPGGPFFGLFENPTDDEKLHWRLWMKQVFMPINCMMEATILGNMHLVETEQVPESFLQFLAHVEAYKVVIAKWDSGDFVQYVTGINFPNDFRSDVAKTFLLLKEKQSRLLNRMR